MRQAFTLIEILLVITIISILSIAGMRGIVNVQRTARVNDAYSRFVSFLDLSRSYALNGKQVDCDGNDTMCVPKSFGVHIDSVVTTSGQTCSVGSQPVQQFFLGVDEPSSNATSHILDTFCVNPLQVSLTSDTSQFQYNSPFGTFSMPYADTTGATTSTPTIIQFCADGTCSNNSYSKSITLYSNVGVPE